jgi:hypothetical protein
MRKVILVTVLSLAFFQMGCSSLKCGCGDETAAKKEEAAAAEKKSCGCEGCKHAGTESCSMKK